MMSLLLRISALFALCLTLVVGCGVPDVSIVPPGGKECNPQTVFPKGAPFPQDGKNEPMFQADGKQYACMSVVWEGLSKPEIGYLARIGKDGKYEVQDPVTKQFSADKVGHTVAPGVEKVDVLFYFFKGKGEGLDCTKVAQGGLAGCLSSPDCLLVWRTAGVPLDPNKGKGTCSLCTRELCDGKDNDCDGKIDNNGACGTILKQDCQYVAKVDAKTPGCENGGSCSCRVDAAGTVYVCAGTDAKTSNWQPLSTIQGQCKTKADGNKTSYCGNIELICDACSTDGSYVWRDRKGGCRAGTLTLEK
jgi:hypothetical protein